MTPSVEDENARIGSTAAELARCAERADCPPDTREAMLKLVAQIRGHKNTGGAHSADLSDQLAAADVYISTARFIEAEEASMRNKLKDDFRRIDAQAWIRAKASAGRRFVWFMVTLAILLTAMAISKYLGAT